MYIYPNYTWFNTYEPLSNRDAASIEYGSFHLDDLNYFLGKTLRKLWMVAKSCTSC